MTVPTRDKPTSFLRSPLSARSLRILLIQARTAPRMVEQEQVCFSERCRLPRDRFRVLNVAKGEPPSPDHLTDVDAVIIGGAGAYSATDDYDWTPDLLDFVRRIVDREMPLFGSCWGHQVIVRALGGRVVYDPEHSELGCGDVELTEAGLTDPLFHRFPPHFRANMGHHDRVVELPSAATELAKNELPYQAFRLEGLPIYGTQFHSELDAERERERILVYRKHYRDALPDEETVQYVLNDLADTTEVDHLLYDFLTTYVARDERLNAAPTSLATPPPSVPVGDSSPAPRRIPEPESETEAPPPGTE